MILQMGVSWEDGLVEKQTMTRQLVGDLQLALKSAAPTVQGPACISTDRTDDPTTCWPGGVMTQLTYTRLTWHIPMSEWTLKTLIQTITGITHVKLHVPWLFVNRHPIFNGQKSSKLKPFRKRKYKQINEHAERQSSSACPTETGRQTKKEMTKKFSMR